MALEHVEELLGVKRPRAVIIELEKDVFDVKFRLQLPLLLEIEFFGCALLTRLEPVQDVLIPHFAAHLATQQTHTDGISGGRAESSKLVCDADKEGILTLPF